MAAATSAASRGVCWDVDGTLADSFLLGYSATKDVLRQAGYAEPSGDEYHAYCIYTTPVRLARHAGLEPGTDEFEQIGADLGRKFDDMYIDLVSTDTAAFFPGVLEIVEGLGGGKVPLGALTNAAVGYAEAVLTVGETHSGCAAARATRAPPATCHHGSPACTSLLDFVRHALAVCCLPPRPAHQSRARRRQRATPLPPPPARRACPL